MNRDEINKKFTQGVVLCRKGKLADAAVLLQQIMDSGSEEPAHVSFYGLLTATAHGRKREGLRDCRRAMHVDPSNPDVVRNLARLYEMCGQRRNAVKTLRRGLQASPGDPQLLNRINHLSPRKRPPLSIVDRNNTLNKHLGILMARVGGTYNKDEDPKGKVQRPAADFELVKS